jgi:hypothetical protein
MRLAVPLFVFAAACGCVSRHAPLRGPVEPEGAVRVIGYFQCRDSTITLHSSAQGPLFSVADASGGSQALYLSVDEFRAAFPDLHERYEAMVVGGEMGRSKDGSSGPLLHILDQDHVERRQAPPR